MFPLYRNQSVDMVNMFFFFFLSPFSAETKLPVMDGNKSSWFESKIKRILLEYLFSQFRLIQNKSLIPKYFIFLHNQNILLQKADMAVYFCITWFHRKVGNGTCDI